MSYYKEFDGNTLNKREFKLQTRRPDLYQEPHQMLLRNMISKNTIYDNILVYHALGTGKTCTSITIAEGFKEYLANMGRKVVVLVKNDNIKQNFVNELMSLCTGNTYVTDSERARDSERSERSDRTRVNKEIENNYWFLNYGTFVNRVLSKRPTSKPITNLSNTVIIVDEAHNITNNDIYTALHFVLSKSHNYRLVLLTATPIRDNPKEIFEMSNILNIHNIQFPIRNQLNKSTPELITKAGSISQGIFKGGITKLTDYALSELSKALQGKVSFLQQNLDTTPKKIFMGTAPSGLPESEKVVLCEMSDFQYNVYKKAIELDLPMGTKDPSEQTFEMSETSESSQQKGSAVYKNSLDAAFFVYPNKSYGKSGFNEFFKKVDKRGNYTLIETNNASMLQDDLHVYSTKLHSIMANIQKSAGPVFVYSNYVNYGGTTLIRQILLANGYQPYNSAKRSDRAFIVMDETTRPEVRERLRRVFCDPSNAHGEKIRILIGSPVISEGITLKNVRQVHITEPTWNKSKINQIIGRAVRNFSHHVLPESERTVEIYKYVAVYSKDPKGIFIDKEMYGLIYEKDLSNKQVERMLKQISFDCHILKSKNTLPKEFDGSPECDYTDCSIHCAYVPRDGKTDNSTYDYYLTDIEAPAIETVNALLLDLFKVYFFWRIDDIIDHIKTKSPDIQTEVIYTVLGDFVDNKRTVKDAYDRDGYIIQRGDYYIFNRREAPVDGSVYSRALDFWVYTNDITFDQFTRNIRPIPKLQEETKAVQKTQLSDSDKQYNESIKNKYRVYGTYLTRDEIFDGKFRIVTDTASDAVRDKRKKISGMAVSSFKKEQLEQLVSQLGIDIQKYIGSMEIDSSLDKRVLETIIQKYLHENERVLKPHS